MGQKNLRSKQEKESMSNQYAKLCPFCEGFIDFYSEDCPYCGSQMDKVENKEIFIPIYQVKSEEPIVALVPDNGGFRSFYSIVVGGVLAPLALFLWGIGGSKGVDITIETYWMPWIFIAAMILLVYGLCKGE